LFSQAKSPLTAGCGRTRFRAALYQGTTSQLAEKLVSATDSYQGMTLVMPQRVENWVRALAPAIVSIVNNVFFRSLFSRADKPFIFDVPSGLQSARNLPFGLFQQPHGTLPESCYL